MIRRRASVAARRWVAARIEDIAQGAIAVAGVHFIANSQAPHRVRGPTASKYFAR